MMGLLKPLDFCGFLSHFGMELELELEGVGGGPIWF